MQERPTTRLRRLLAQPGCVLTPGAADAMVARLIARAGFDAIHMTGFGTAVGRLGMPDIGLLTATEMVDNVARIYDASGLCIVADADTGYGNAMNTRRTVRDYEKAGAAAFTWRTRWRPSAAATWPASASSPPSRWSARSRPPATPGTTRTW